MPLAASRALCAEKKKKKPRWLLDSNGIPLRYRIDPDSRSASDPRLPPRICVRVPYLREREKPRRDTHRDRSGCVICQSSLVVRQPLKRILVATLSRNQRNPPRHSSPVGTRHVISGRRPSSLSFSLSLSLCLLIFRSVLGRSASVARYLAFLLRSRIYIPTEKRRVARRTGRAFFSGDRI